MKKYLWIMIFVVSFMGCESFRGGRKPQAAGFGGYCPTCITQNIDKDLAKLQSNLQQVNYKPFKNPLQVDQVILFDKNGKAVCYADLNKHPDLVPSFFKRKKQFVQTKSKQNRKLASSEEDLNLPHCSKEHLAKLKKVTKSKVTINGKKFPMQKTSILSGSVACAIGGSAGIVISYLINGATNIGNDTSHISTEEMSTSEFITIVMTAAYGLVKGLSAFKDVGGTIPDLQREKAKTQLAVKSKIASKKMLKKSLEKIDKAQKKVLKSRAKAVAALCTAGGIAGMVAYRNSTAFHQGVNEITNASIGTTPKEILDSSADMTSRGFKKIGRGFKKLAEEIEPEKQ